VEEKTDSCQLFKSSTFSFHSKAKLREKEAAKPVVSFESFPQLSKAFLSLFPFELQGIAKTSG
jgi:hypothetical protein